MAARASLSTLLQLPQADIRETQVVAQLMSECPGHGRPEAGRRGVGAHERTAEQRDAAGPCGGVRAVGRPRHTLVQPQQAEGVGGRELLRGRPLLDDHRHGPELLPEGRWKAVDGVVERGLERVGGARR